MHEAPLRVFDPDGREVVFDKNARAHLHLRGRSWLLDHIDAILAAIALPHYRDHDIRPGRERFYARHLLLPTRWLCVVVDFNDVPAWVVTVFVQGHPPRGRTR